MITKFDIEDALLSENPTLLLRGQLILAIQHGLSLEVLRKNLEDLRRDFVFIDGEKSEDLILEMLDFLDGWCNSDMRLYK